MSRIECRNNKFKRYFMEKNQKNTINFMMNAKKTKFHMKCTEIEESVVGHMKMQ